MRMPDSAMEGLCGEDRIRPYGACRAEIRVSPAGACAGPAEPPSAFRPSQRAPARDPRCARRPPEGAPASRSRDPRVGRRSVRRPRGAVIRVSPVAARAGPARVRDPRVGRSSVRRLAGTSLTGGCVGSTVEGGESEAIGPYCPGRCPGEGAGEAPGEAVAARES
nr:hypothetical protein GCM10020063_102460 [Dactylosporangium thailandense]